MLERNRGARRDRTHTKKERGYRALRGYVTSIENGTTEGGWFFLKGRSPRAGEAMPLTEVERRQAGRYFLCNEGRVNVYENRCIECRHGREPADWCFAGAVRQQQRLDDSLNADYDAWRLEA